MWHASVSVIDHSITRRVVQASDLNRWSRRLVCKYAKELLAGVGRVPSVLELGGVCIHYRRSLTDDEIASLSTEWLAIPGDSLAGHGILLEKDT